MKLSRNVLPMVALVFLYVLAASAQTPPSDAKEFNKDGLTFSYPSGWSFNDTSDSDAQKMTFGRNDSDAQVTVFVFRTHVNTPEKIAEAKKVLVDKYVASTIKSFEQAGARPESSPTTSEIGGVKSEGVRIKASLDGVPGAADIQWAVLGERLVVLTFLGPDRALTKAASIWDSIRSSMKVEEAQLLDLQHRLDHCGDPAFSKVAPVRSSASEASAVSMSR